MPSLRQDLAGLPGNSWVIFAGIFINKFGNFVNVFVMLYLTAEGYSAAQAGLALAAIGVGSFIGNILGGTLADVYGRRITIMISMFGAGFVTIAAPFLMSSLPVTILVLGVLGSSRR